MGISKENLEKNIKKMLSVIKPEGVLMVEFKLSNIYGDNSRYYLNLTYVLPDNSPYLNRANTGASDNIRMTWNREIKKSIENYFSTYIIINSTSLSSETFYKQQKEREKLWQKN